MDTQPDSALVLLEEIGHSLPESRKFRADHALLLTMARDKNYIFERDDSLISTAIDYFDSHPDPEKSFFAHFYRASILNNREDYSDAMVDGAIALRQASQNDDAYQLAKIHELMADIYAGSFHIHEAINHRRQAAVCYGIAGKQKNRLYALLDLAREYYQDDEPEMSFCILDSVPAGECGDDSILLGYRADSYIRPLLMTGRYDEARRYHILAREYWRGRYENGHNLVTLSRLYTCLGETDSARMYLDRLRQSDPRSRDDVGYHYASYEYYHALDSVPQALRSVEEMMDANWAKVRGILENNVALAERDYYNGMSEIERLRAARYHLISVMLGLLIIMSTVGFVLYHRARIKRKEIAMDELMYQAHDLRSEISDMDIRMGLQKQLVEKLFANHFMTLDNLANEYFDKKDSDTLRKTIIKDFEDEIMRIKTPDSMDMVIDIVNDCRDNLIDRLRSQMPKLKEADIVFIALIVAGFSPRAICLFTDIKLGNYYNKWTRLRQRIEKSGAHDTEFFLSTIFRRGDRGNVECDKNIE